MGQIMEQHLGREETIHIVREYIYNNIYPFFHNGKFILERTYEI